VLLAVAAAGLVFAGSSGLP